jgi:type I restriction enzyme M protein
MQYEEFKDCLAWWPNREENEHAWRVHASDILANGCNLDIKNPNNKQDIEHMPPEQIVEDIVRKEQRILEIMGEMRDILGRSGNNE